MADEIFFLGYTHVCHVYEDGIRIRHEQDAPLEGIRLDKHRSRVV
jgi:hypothetical protein